jgi:DNA primase small subunit
MSGLEDVSMLYVYNVFSKYYRESARALRLPYLMEKREFGFLLFKEQIMLRHKNFINQNELASFLENVTPSDIYHSCAYYADPAADMDRKGWIGADLIFDIDADHIRTSCNKVHDEWTCGGCGFIGKGPVPENCPVCSGQKFNVKSWPCDFCLETAKEETVKLLDMLMQDFGFSESEIHVFFSGHRGYHVHVESEAVKSLDTVARKEMVDYVSGLGLDMPFHGLNWKNQRVIQVLSLHSLNFGWYKRLARGMQNFIQNAKEEDFREIGLKKNAATAILRNRDLILKNLLDTGIESVVRGIGLEAWKKIAGQVVKLQSAQIDTVVTTDTHRLIRLAGTLHGKTGFKKVEFPLSALDDFDPFKSAIAFKDGTATVFVSSAPKFRLGDETFGPYKDQKVELPTAVAVLLICKGRAKIAE